MLEVTFKCTTTPTFCVENGRNVKAKSLGEQNKEKILSDIARSEPEGRTTGELTRDTGLSRETIYTQCKELQDLGLISKKGKFAKYRLTDKTLYDPTLSAWVFRGEVMRGIARWSVPWTRPNKFCRLEPNTPDKEYETEAGLFDFANKIGALIVYVLLHALRPRDTALNGSSKMKVVNLSGKVKTEQAKRWVENTISPFLILREFSNLDQVAEGLAVHYHPPIDESLSTKIKEKKKEAYKKRRKMDPHDPFWTGFELDRENFNRLTAAFANVYPEINAQLEYIRKTLPDKIQRHKEWDRKHSEEQRKKKISD